MPERTNGLTGRWRLLAGLVLILGLGLWLWLRPATPQPGETPPTKPDTTDSTSFRHPNLGFAFRHPPDVTPVSDQLSAPLMVHTTEIATLQDSPYVSRSALQTHRSALETGTLPVEPTDQFAYGPSRRLVEFGNGRYGERYLRLLGNQCSELTLEAVLVTYEHETQILIVRHFGARDELESTYPRYFGRPADCGGALTILDPDQFSQDLAAGRLVGALGAWYEEFNAIVGSYQPAP